MKDKRTIIYAGKFELPDKNAEAQRVVANAKALRHLGYRVIFVGISHDNPPQNDVKKTKAEWFGFESYTRPYPKSIFGWIEHISTNDELAQVLMENEKSTTALILYNYPALATARILQYCRKRTIKVVADCTEWYAPFAKHTRPSPIKFIDTAWRMHRLNKKVDALVAISTYLFDYYKDFVPTILLPPLVDLEDEKWALSKERQKKCTILYAGSPGRKDRLDLVVESVFDHRKDLQLWVIGAQEDEFLSHYPQHRIKDLSMVTFFGRLDHQEVLAKIKKADYTCFFRDSTRMSNAGFPTKFVESVSCGVGVITNATSDIRDYADKIGGCIVLENLNKKEISDAFEQALSKQKQELQNDYFDYRHYLDEIKTLTALF